MLKKNIGSFISRPREQDAFCLIDLQAKLQLFQKLAKIEIPLNFPHQKK